MKVEIKLGKEQVYTIMNYWSQLDNDGMMFKEWLLKKHKLDWRHVPDIAYLSGEEKDITMFLLRWS